MMLIILDKDAIKSAELIPDSLKFKQLLELCQLICSAGYSDVYKKVPQGKDIQQWILKNPIWTKKFAIALYELCNFVNMSESTMKNILDMGLIPGLCVHSLEHPPRSAVRQGA